MRVGMAVGAAAGARGAAGRGRRAAAPAGPAVAGIAGDREVAAAQREARLGVLGGPEAGGPEARHVVAALAAARRRCGRDSSPAVGVARGSPCSARAACAWAGPGLWHAAQATAACLPWSG